MVEKYLKCPKCGYYNPLGQKFCGACGREFQIVSGDTGTRELAQPRGGKGSSKQLTVLILAAVIFIVVFAIVWTTFDSLSGSSSKSATIRIQSDTNWSGSIGTLASSRSIDGSGSQDFKLNGDVFSAVIQKSTEEGYVTVSIIADGVVRATETTTAAYGVASVSWGNY